MVTTGDAVSSSRMKLVVEFCILSYFTYINTLKWTNDTILLRRLYVDVNYVLFLPAQEDRH